MPTFAQWKCRSQIPVRYIYKLKKYLTKQNICYKLTDNYLQWMSKKCYQRRGRCLQKINKLVAGVPKERSEYGNPYFKRCLLAGGDAKLVDILLEGKWRSTSQCSFDKDLTISITLLP